MAISMLKIRRPLGRLIFNMGIAIPGKTVFLIETAPRTADELATQGVRTSAAMVLTQFTLNIVAYVGIVTTGTYIVTGLNEWYVMSFCVIYIE